MNAYYITHREPKWLDPSITVLDSPDRCIEMFKNTDVIGGDTENNGLNTILAIPLLTQFSDGVDSYVIDRTVDSSWLKDYTNRTILTQNGQYDYRIWKRHYGVEFRKMIDIMIEEQILGRGSGRSNSLESIHQRRLNKFLPLPKSTRNSFGKMGPNSEIELDHVKYSAYDPYCLFEIHKAILPLIHNYNLTRRVFDIAMPLIPILGDMCHEGFYLDEPKWKQVLRDNKEGKYHVECKLDEIVREFAKDHIRLKGCKWTRKRFKTDGEQAGLFNDSVTIGNESDKNISYGSIKDKLYIFNVLKEPIPQAKDKKTQEYKDSFAEEALEQYKIEYPSSRMTNFINGLLEYAKYDKEINSFGEIFLKDRVKDGKSQKQFKRGYKNSITGLVHTVYKQEFTKNGRLSSGDSKRGKKENGVKPPGVGFYNSQQIPKKNKFRNCFTLSPQEKEEGWKVRTDDLTGAEIVIFASQSQDKNLIKVLQEGKDLHCFLASPAYTSVIQYILKEMNFSRALDEIMHLLKPNRLTESINGKTKQELEDINKIRVADAMSLYRIDITKKDHPDIRDPFKNVTFGILYGATENKTAEILNIAPHFAKLILDGMKATLPDGFAYLDSVARFGVKNGYIIANKRTNSRHWFKEWLDAKQQGRDLTNKEKSSIERFCKNYVMSATQADMIKESMVNIDKWVRENNIDFRWKLQVHDELVYLFKEDYVPIEIQKIIIDTCNLYLEDNVRMKVASYTGMYWNKD